MLAKIWAKMGTAYRAEVGKRLASRGLLYEDLLVETADVKLALSRLPKDVLAAREQRLKRALVLGSQQRYLPDEVADKIDPFERYLSPYIEAVQEAKKEVRSRAHQEGWALFSLVALILMPSAPLPRPRRSLCSASRRVARGCGAATCAEPPSSVGHPLRGGSARGRLGRSRTTRHR